MNFLSALAKWMPLTVLSSFFGLVLYCKWHFCVIVGAWIEGFYGLSLFGNGLMVVVGVWIKFVLQYHILLSMENCDQSSIWAATRPVISLCKLSIQDFFGTVGLIYYQWRRENLTKRLLLLLAFFFCFVCDCYFHSLQAFSFLQHDILRICVKRFRTGHKKLKKN